ncbi:MAG: GNAT family N-acetyltransferase [Salaquimonas sp.]
MDQETVYQIRILPGFGEIDAEAWNALAQVSREDGSVERNPFLSHAYLSSLEESGSASVETGWYPQHLILETQDGQKLGAMICYLKNHSQGEYVFDHGWADAFYRAGGEYYPKLQSAVPFTPATGPRFLTGKSKDPEPIRAALSAGLTQLTEKSRASSAHITFMQKSEWESVETFGYLQRTDRQFHWHNQSYDDFDAFLESLSSRKRKNIRKERKTALGADGLTIEQLTGDQITEEALDAFYAFYMDTGSRKWGQPYLNRKFYSLIAERMADDILLIMVKRNGAYVAGAINFIGDDCLYGRHWGCIEEYPCLHFEVCYYQAIDYAIVKGLKRVEAGAQGEHKLARGYVPVTTYSAHHIANPGFRDAVEAYLENERRHVEMEKDILTKHTPFKRA